MDEMQLTKLDGSTIAAWNFSALKAELTTKLEEYKNLAYTDDAIKEAKSDRTELNKLKKTITDAEKEYKARCLAPYEAIKPQIRELVDIVEEQRMVIDSVVKDYDSRKKAEKEQEIRKFYDRKSAALGEYAAALYEKIFDSKWTNATTAKSKYEEAILEAINKAAADIETVKSWQSVYTNTLIETYVDTLSVEKAKDEDLKLNEAAEKAGLTEKVQPAAPAQTSAAAGDGVLLKVRADERQLRQICDFMKAIGVDYELC